METRTYGRAEKAKLYEATGVPGAWAFDPGRHEAVLLVLVGSTCAEIEQASGVDRSTVLSELISDPAVLFANLDG